ncbi:zinc finger CCCH domain-containing protein 13-like [Topomyia yanbarensis]|uniref:zinc finger CCCH domain-containing protein 13-like n=1 Tax=Topomyia yanbarensis TaxID=2498891 RepID=UPI00273B768B|nr:zinc finger CCCH domain-containing protein 13-like [Topomyia yanbarensis]
MNYIKVNTYRVCLGTTMLVLCLVPVISGLQDHRVCDVDGLCEEIAEGSRYHSDRRVDRLDQDQEQRLLLFNREKQIRERNEIRELERTEEPRLDTRDRREERSASSDRWIERNTDDRRLARSERDEDRQIHRHDRESVRVSGDRRDRFEEMRYRDESQRERAETRIAEREWNDERRVARDGERQEQRETNDGRRDRRSSDDRDKIRDELDNIRERRHEQQVDRHIERTEPVAIVRKVPVLTDDRRERTQHREQNDIRVLRTENRNRFDDNERRMNTDNRQDDRETDRRVQRDERSEETHERIRTDRRERDERESSRRGVHQSRLERLDTAELFTLANTSEASFIWNMVQVALIVLLVAQLMKKSEMDGTWKPSKLAELVCFRDSTIPSN